LASVGILSLGAGGAGERLRHSAFAPARPAHYIPAEEARNAPPTNRKP
jgi:hypothetical protein